MTTKDASVEDRFTALAQHWIDDAAKLKPSEVEAELYHYTDAAGLFGMLNSNELWLTDSRFLNDSKECTHLNEEASALLARDYETSEDDIVKYFSTEAIDYIDSQSGAATYVFSLTAERDDLSQWRGYAKDGHGFTIGFDGPALYQASCDEGTEFVFSRVEYSPEKQANANRNIANAFIKMLRQELSKPDADKSYLVDTAARHFCWCIDSRSAFSKHESFGGEREWRLASYSTEDDDDIRVRVSATSLIPYVKLNISSAAKLPISSIGIGPGFRDPHISKAVEALCRQTGHKLQIYQANTPYRRL